MNINTKETRINPKDIFFRALEAQKRIGNIALDLGHKFLTQEKPTRNKFFMESKDLADPFLRERR